MIDLLEERQATFLAEEHNLSEETVGLILCARLYLVTGGVGSLVCYLFCIAKICSLFKIKMHYFLLSDYGVQVDPFF